MSDINLIVVGLGNPEEERKNTRHNTGYMVVDRLLARSPICYNEWTFNNGINAMISEMDTRLVVKPTTGMNSSGDIIKPLFDSYSIAKDPTVFVVYDDITLPFGHISIRNNYYQGGHNGVKSIHSALLYLGENFGNITKTTMRMGIGKPNCSVLDYVLGDFSENELANLDATVLPRAVDAIWKFEREGKQKAIEFLRSVQQ